MKKILVMLTKTPFGNDENLSRLSRCQKDDIVIFAQDSVFSFSTPELEIAHLIQEKLDLGVRIFASEADCEARGMNPPIGIKRVGYPEQVDLIGECELSF
jgi:sulfur relay protein TusB/DsrH